MRLALLLACTLAAGPGPGSGAGLGPATTDICATAPAGLPAPGGR